MFSEISDYTNKLTSVFEPALIAELETKSMLMKVSAGETLLEVGKPVRAVPLVVSGTIKVSRINDEGQELLLYYIKEGETCPMSFTCWMTSQASSVKGAAEDDTTIICIPVSLLDGWLSKYPTWKKFVMTTILDGLTEVVKSIDDVAFKKMDDRLIKYLKEKSKATNSSLINLTHQQIGDELGTNRVVVSRLLKKLENDHKLLLYRNQIKLLHDL